LAITELDMPLQQILGALSWRPAAVIGAGETHGLPVAEGNPANLCVIDLEETWTVDGAAMASRSANTPYQGRELRGRVRHTVLHGEPVVISGEPQR
jgi:dihydroorotase